MPVLNVTRTKKIRIRIKIDKPYLIILFCAYTIALTLLMDLYITSGDQSFYKAYYEDLSSLSFIEGYYSLRARLGASEPVYHVIMFFSANLMGLERITMITIANTLLAYLLITWLIKHKFPISLIPFIALNFYLMVFFFSAERLKFGFLFFAFAWRMKGAFKYGLLAFSILSHFQMFILFFLTLTSYLIQLIKILHGKINNKAIKSIIIISLSFILMGYYSNAIIEKVIYYIDLDNLAKLATGLLKVGAYFFFTLLLFWKKRVAISITFIPLFLAAIVVGGERIVIFSFLVFLYYCIVERRVWNPFLIASFVYFLYKGIIFINNVVLYGDGFKH